MVVGGVRGWGFWSRTTGEEKLGQQGKKGRGTKGETEEVSRGEVMSRLTLPTGIGAAIEAAEAKVGTITIRLTGGPAGGHLGKGIWSMDHVPCKSIITHESRPLPPKPPHRSLAVCLP